MGGEINGLVLCYKSAPLPSNSNPMLNRVLPSLPAVNLKPTTNSGFTSSTPVVSPTPYTKNSSNANPQIKSPVRPAPLPPLNNDKPSPEDNPATKNHLNCHINVYTIRFHRSEINFYFILWNQTVA